MFIRRHVDIAAESRYYENHTADKRLSRKAFLPLIVCNVQNRSFSSEDVANMVESYRTRINSNEHIDFDDRLSVL